MTPPTPDAPAFDERSFVFGPLPLADGALALVHLHRLSQAQTGPDADRRIALRMAEITRRFLPEAALAQLDRISVDPPLPPEPLLHPATIRALALIETGRVGEASLLVPDVPATWGLRELVVGRIAVADGRLDSACARLRAAADRAGASDEPMAAEVRVEALSVLLRVRLGLRQDTEALFVEIESACESLDAGITLGIHRALNEARDGNLFTRLAEALARVAHTQLKADYCVGFEAERRSIAPIPLQVHGALKRHADDSPRYVRAILDLSALAWRSGFPVEGFETAYYGLKIGQRRFGEAAVAPVGQYLAGLEAQTPGPEWQRVVDKARKRAAQASN